MVASGFAGLGYQIVWTQQAALWLGHEAAAVLAVITAFFGGLALGAWALGPRIERSARPERAYAACEIAIALWSGVLAWALAPVSGWVLDATGAQPTPLWQWAVAFGATFLLLLPATAAMGATLPAMARVLARLQGAGTAALPALYACNTLGAMLGVLATAFWLVPTFGLARTAAVCAALNGLCAVAALRLAARAGATVSATQGLEPARERTHEIGHEVAHEAANAAAPLSQRTPARSTLAVLAATGLLGIAYEVLVVRVLSQVTEATVYTFAALLAVYLAGTALGAALWQRWRPQAGAERAPTQRSQDRLLCALAAACLLGSASLWGAEVLRDSLHAALGGGMAAAVLVEAVLALAAFALPTALMGALFSALSLQAQASGLGFSRALAVNTLGAAAAPPLFGVLLVPALGPKLSLLLVVAGYLALAAPRVRLTPKVWATTAAAAATAAATAAVALWAPPLAFVDLPEGGRLVSYREGALAAVSVVEDASGVSRLRINNRQQEGSSHTQRSDARQALLPLLLHPAPQRVLFLGLGTGSTATHMLHVLAEALGDGRLRDIVGVPTSDAIGALAQQLGVPIATLDQRPQLDLALDGADEIDPALNLIKGLGGALLREKIVESSAARFIVLADETKLVAQLGARVPLPVEVVQFGLPLATRRLAELGAAPSLRRVADGSAFRTDEGNVILDCRFPGIADSAALNAALNAIPSVVEHGLFVGMASVALVGGPAGVATIVRQ